MLTPAQATNLYADQLITIVVSCMHGQYNDVVQWHTHPHTQLEILQGTCKHARWLVCACWIQCHCQAIV